MSEGNPYPPLLVGDDRIVHEWFSDDLLSPKRQERSGEAVIALPRLIELNGRRYLDPLTSRGHSLEGIHAV